MSIDNTIATSTRQTVKMPSDLINGQEVPEISPRTGKPKRRKAIRACIHCQRTHLTCDNNRPCERCISRGLGDTCRDGARKKAKYLGNDDPQKRGRAAAIATGAGAGTPQPAHQSTVMHVIPPQVQPQIAAPPPSQLIDQVPAPPLAALPKQEPYAAQPTEFYPQHFQSTTTGSEYNVLSQILNAEASPHSDHSMDGVTYSAVPMAGSSLGPENYTLENFNVNELGGLEQTASPQNDWLQPPKQPTISLTINQHYGAPSYKNSTVSVYKSVVRAFPYKQGFHTLFRYLQTRFGKEQLMQIANSMAKYRPSIIAYASTLTPEDMVFLEQCFQRSLLEYERYFSYSGTPTIIWRRTGQIAAVGPEFCMLTGYDMNELLPSDTGSGKFIIELMDDESTVNYFQTFSEIAFGDHRGVRMAGCTLITKSAKHIRTGSVLTLKRDMFGIPMLIIGNFLPVLQK